MKSEGSQGITVKSSQNGVRPPLAESSIFTCQKFISLKFVVHILFAVKNVFPKDLKPTLVCAPWLSPLVGPTVCHSKLRDQN